MALYTITDPETGEVIKIRGDAPPTDADLEELFNVRRSEKNKTALNVPAPGLEKPPDPSTQVPGASGARARTAERLGLAGSSAPNVSVDDAIGSLPAVGGTIGGIAALPAAAAAGVATAGGAAVPVEMLGSGLGGGAGEGLRQWIQSARGKESMTPEERREAIAKEFSIQATLPAVTVPIKAAARGLYKGALDAGANILNQFDIKALTERGLKENILASRGGAEKAGRLLAGSGERTGNIAAAADVRGVPPSPPSELLPGLDPSLNKLAGGGGKAAPSAAELNMLAQKEADILGARSSPRSMAELEQMVRQGTIDSANAYTAAAKLGVPVGMEAEAERDVVNQGRKILYDRVPEIVPEKKRAQELVGITKLLKSKKESKPLGFLDYTAGTLGATLGLGTGGPGAAAFGAIAAPAAMRAIRSPLGRSAAGIVTEKVGVPLGRAGAEAIRYRDALLRMLGMANDEQQSPPNQ